jgi:hypothetical protein
MSRSDSDILELGAEELRLLTWRLAGGVGDTEGEVVVVVLVVLVVVELEVLARAVEGSVETTGGVDSGVGVS